MGILRSAGAAYRALLLTIPMNLSSNDHGRLLAASEVMLRPFAHDSPLKYLVAVAEHLIPLLGGFASICGTRDPEGVVGIDSAQWSDEVIAEFARWKLRDPGTERVVRLGSDVAIMRKIAGVDWDEFDRDPMVNEWYRPNGVRDVAAYILQWPEDDALATIELHASEFGTPRFGEEGEFLLTLLQPPLRAGMRLLYTAGRLRDTVARDMDVLGVPLCVCARDGNIHHLSSGVRGLLAADPESATVLRRIREVAREVDGGHRRSARAAFPSKAVHQIVTTRTRRYRLSAALATHGMQFGRTDVLLTVTELNREAQADGDLASQYALSPRERQVAMLLGRGLSTQDIAATLDVSVHTVKRHTERVFAKLGVRTRAAVAALIGTLGLS